MTTDDRIRHFSLIRGFHVADLFTIANGFCGVLAVFAAIHFARTADPSVLRFGAALIPLAIVFDFLDGRVARFRHQASPMGRELDSLADLISFGVAPAALAYAAGVDTRLDAAALVLFAGCGLSRLARYNVTAAALADETGKVKYFEGTPITFSLLPLAILLGLHAHGDLIPLGAGPLRFHLPAVFFFVSGCLMISKTLRIPKP